MLLSVFLDLQMYIGNDIINGNNMVQYKLRSTKYKSYVEAHDCAVGTSRGANNVLGDVLPAHVVNELTQGGKSLNEYTTREIIDMGYNRAAPPTEDDIKAAKAPITSIIEDIDWYDTENGFTPALDQLDTQIKLVTV